MLLRATAAAAAAAADDDDDDDDAAREPYWLLPLPQDFVHRSHIQAARFLFPLALSKPFFVGELISISSAGGAPGDAPSTHLMGFVEGITWSHVVIRDVKKKQNFVPHAEFSSLTIHNWTRRPAKLCTCTLRVAGAPKDAASRVATIAKFARWSPHHTHHATQQACHTRGTDR